MSRLLARVAIAWCAILVSAAQADDEAARASGSEIAWLDDYTAATNEAVRARKMLFLFFHDPQQTPVRKAFEGQVLVDEVLQPFADRYVWAKVPTNATIVLDGRTTRILSHPAMAEMKGRQGIAVIDYATADKNIYGRVVSAFPFRPGRLYGRRSLTVILDLPSGTITQRTMIFAVRTHPEAPASASGVMSRTLAYEARSHSLHQATIGVQGHHDWETRFHRINSKLGGMTAREVVAESWPDKDLIDACIDCVHSWRQSEGHWSAVRSRHRVFAYDIQRGLNGIWYATGLFAR